MDAVKARHLPPTDAPIPEVKDKGLKATIDSAAKQVAQKGFQHEYTLLKANGMQPNWSFLNHTDPLWPYFRHQIHAAQAS